MYDHVHFVYHDFFLHEIIPTTNIMLLFNPYARLEGLISAPLSIFCHHSRTSKDMATKFGIAVPQTFAYIV